jgi:PAS domain S-box-containing protein
MELNTCYAQDVDRALKILHLEDDANDADLIEAQLVRGGFQSSIRRVETGEAFEAALLSDTFDVILVDYNLPTYDGRRAVILSQRLRRDVPVIVLSGMAGEEAAVECLHLGAVDYVLKYRPARFVPAVERALREAALRQRSARAEALERESAELRERAAEQLRLAIEAAPAGMIMTDGGGRMTLVNAEAERLFGYPRAEMLDRSIENLIPTTAWNPHGALRTNARLVRPTRVIGVGGDLYGLRKDGGQVPIEIGINALTTPDGEFALWSILDISARRRSEQELRQLNAELQERVLVRTAELRERESLLQEVHHRVKNNLQVMTSLINMQIRTLADPSSRRALQECRSRIETMAQIHESLYRARDYAQVLFSKYAQEVVRRVLAAGASPDEFRVDFHLDEVYLPVDKAIPCGLILNELVAICLQQRSADAAKRGIRVELRRLPDAQVLLAVVRDTLAPPANPVSQEPQALGMQLVTLLVEQLHARIDSVGAAGAGYRITIPVPAHEGP